MPLCECQRPSEALLKLETRGWSRRCHRDATGKRQFIGRSCSLLKWVSINVFCKPVDRAIVRAPRSQHEADGEHGRASERFGVASQSDVADDRVSAEKASPTRRECCSRLGQAHRQAGRIQATPTTSAWHVGENQTESGAIAGHNEDNAMPPPYAELSPPRTTNRTTVSAANARQRRTEARHVTAGSRKERRVRRCGEGASGWTIPLGLLGGFLVSACDDNDDAGGGGGGYRRHCNRYYRVINLTVTQVQWPPCPG